MADSRIAYGLAKENGIDTKGMSPKQVWQALKDKGISVNKEDDEQFPDAVEDTTTNFFEENEEKVLTKDNEGGKIINFVDTYHSGKRKQERHIENKDITEALSNPVAIIEGKMSKQGKHSKVYIGTKHTVVYNPQNNKIVTVYRTDPKKLSKYEKEKK